MIKQNHAVSILIYHLVFVTKYRERTLAGLSPSVFKNVETYHPEIKIIESSIEDENHVHLLIQAKTNIPPSEIARIIKGVTWKKVRDSVSKWSGWSKGYYISSVGGKSVKSTINYINKAKEEYHENNPDNDRANEEIC